jgi:hypothetical protein
MRSLRTHLALEILGLMITQTWATQGIKEDSVNSVSDNGCPGIGSSMEKGDHNK